MNTAATTEARNTVSESSIAGARDPSEHALAERILQTVLRRRRLVPEHQHLLDTSTPSCRAPHLALCERAVRAGEPVHFIFPAFPGKSQNPNKTLGFLPDLGERLALEHLKSLCEDVRAVYAPGARITLCSDARLFTDLLGIPDDHVAGYQAALAALIAEIAPGCIDRFAPHDAYEDVDYAAIREEVLIDHGTSIFELRRRVRDGDADARTLFLGMQRLVVEDHAALFPELTVEALRAASKTLAYRLIQRSLAWTQLVQTRFPQSLRLSIHPQRADSAKIGIMLVPSDDAWDTPWHNVVVLRGGRATLMKRQWAEELGAELVLVDGIPSHFVLSDTSGRPISSVSGETR